MSHQSESLKSILFALLANLGIAITKSVAAVITGSGAMLAEAVHSFADCGNQGLLFFGIRTSRKIPDKEHPLGYGKEIYFWSFIVALILFSMGGVFSVYEGVHKLHNHGGLNRPYIAISVLLISMTLEGASLFGCIKQINKIRQNQTIWKWVINTRKSELVVVLGEDIAALLGLSFALISVLFSILTKNPVFDAIGSIGIGVLLVFVSIFLAIKVKGLLIGQSAENETRESIIHTIEDFPEVNQVLNLITLQLGSGIMVAVKAKMLNTPTPEMMIDNINKCEQLLRKKIPDIQWIFFEPDIVD